MNQLDWDIYFLKIAKTVSENSKCMSRHIGAVLVKDKSVLSTGYNGPAVGVKHCNERPISFYMDNFDCKLPQLVAPGSETKTQIQTDKLWICPRRFFGFKSGQGLNICQAGHAERNALIQAAKHGISTKGTTLYCYCPQVCKDCAIEIVNAGIVELVYLDGDPYDAYSETILKESGILIRQIKNINL